MLVFALHIHRFSSRANQCVSNTCIFVFQKFRNMIEFEFRSMRFRVQSEVKSESCPLHLAF